jgi:hypothetical protein
LVLAGAERSVVASLQLAKKSEAVTNIAISLILVKSKFLQLGISFLNSGEDLQSLLRKSGFGQWQAQVETIAERPTNSSAKRSLRHP